MDVAWNKAPYIRYPFVFLLLFFFNPYSASIFVLFSSICGKFRVLSILARLAILVRVFLGVATPVLYSMDP